MLIKLKGLPIKKGLLSFMFLSNIFQKDNLILFLAIILGILLTGIVILLSWKIDTFNKNRKLKKIKRVSYKK